MKIKGGSEPAREGGGTSSPVISNLQKKTRPSSQGPRFFHALRLLLQRSRLVGRTQLLNGSGLGHTAQVEAGDVAGAHLSVLLGRKLGGIVDT
jgi:hypothetical protein